MSVFNRSKDVSEQRERFYIPMNGNVGIATGTSTWTGVIPTGVTMTAMIVPYPCTIDEAQISAWGLSGTPQYTLAVNRFIAGTGFTTWNIAQGTSNTPAAYGTSGAGAFGTSTLGWSGMVFLNAAGSTLNNLVANDLLTVTTGGANTAAVSVCVGIVLKPIQDVKVNFGLI